MLKKNLFNKTDYNYQNIETKPTESNTKYINKLS